ncbi:M23 family metallopeptidase [Herbiconiux sp. KACC 21604]|uniref:M23 family metallopeptidase n=1 Tax=unclassified Herbiconiux TaxID=2618217 RepID=UPI0014915035|nr:M23 family metallopeptidase [Herbiconiux sp. SALV-R1]QJU52311.1 M23 family metallopeptidase [Herbiconiux sp. SALV-R1]WPO87159.1 M23 family metallopeptidase [Herbiconiux sp. KACC 21604]
MHTTHPATTRSRPRRPRRRLGATLAATASLVAAAVFSGGPAFADDYPSWDDVKNAQANESAKQDEITRIEGLIQSISSQVSAAQALSTQRGEEYQVAQTAFDTASYVADELEAQAEEASAEAERSNTQAGLLAAQLARTGGNDITLNLMVGGEQFSNDLLYQLGAMSKLTEKTAQIYAKAQQDTNTATALTAQATVARNELKGLAEEAQRLFAEAVVAQQAAEAALQEQQDHEVELTAQLAVLKENRAATEADYQKGVEARAEAARAAAAAGLPTLPFIAASGWASPFPGSYSSDEFGMRVNPVSGAYIMHSGLDLVYSGGTCGAYVYASAEGLVTYAGWNGGYGNFVQVDHGGGIATAYGHNTTLLVGNGDYVQVGQPIALAGTTGNSTGCHVHYEVRVSGGAVNPRAFMANVGIEFG